MPQTADTLITNATLVTLNPGRDIVLDGALAITGKEIAAVGSNSDVVAEWTSSTTIDGRGFVITPGYVNAHIHVTGEPLTRGFVPDDVDFAEHVFEWLVPLYAAHSEEDERLAAQLAATEMLRSGTTTFLEAGTVRFPDAVVDGLAETGIRARVGRWTWDLPPEPEAYRLTTEEALAGLEDVATRYASAADGRIKGWTILVGHTTCSDDLWRGAKQVADAHGIGMSFHMSPAAMDPEGFLEQHGRRPIEHLADLGVLDSNVMITHVVHCSDDEVELLAETQTSVAHCPTTSLKEAYGSTAIGKFPEMEAAGVNIAIGTDGANAANYSDMLRAAYLVAGLYKDSRQDAKQFSAERCLEMITLGGARGLLAEAEIGSLEVGKKADLVMHETDRPEWQPLFNVAAQLIWSADGRSVHSVFVDGQRVVDNHSLTAVDEHALAAEAQRAGDAIIERSGRPLQTSWPQR